MLICANCDKVIKECCDIYFPAKDESGSDCFLCGECAEKLEAEGRLDEAE